MPRYIIFVGDRVVATAMHRRQAKRIARAYRGARVVKPRWMVIEF